VHDESLNDSASRRDGELWAGDVADAIVVSVSAEGVGVRLGGHEAQIQAPAQGAARLTPGDALKVFVEQVEPALVVSAKKAAALALWDTLAAAAQSGEVIEGTVITEIKGGLSVDVGTKAFLPASEADARPRPDLASLVGQRLAFKVIRFGAKKGNIVLSRKEFAAAERDEQKQAALAALAVGDVRTGTVKSFTTYGAFVDLGGLDGLLHVSDMSWGKVSHPEQMYKKGDEVTVKVLKLEADRQRISLGTKQLTPDPWSTLSERLQVGGDVSGKVLRLADFGAFIEIEPGIEGLCHISEMSWQRGKRPSELVAEGDVVRARVLHIDTRERRIALGIKQLQANPWAAFLEAHPIGSQVTGAVRSLTDFGIFVRVADGIDGLVHVTDFSWTERVKHPSERYKKGDEVTAVVLDVDAERIALGIKQLAEDPWASLARRLPAGSKVTGKVTRVVDFGAFVELEPGLEGLCHVSELAHERVEHASDVVKPGDALEVMILDLDRREHKISLSVKAAQAGPASYRKILEEAREKEAGFRNSLGDKLAQKIKGGPESPV